MSKRLRIVIQCAHARSYHAKSIEGKTWHIEKCKLYEDKDIFVHCKEVRA